MREKPPRNSAVLVLRKLLPQVLPPMVLPLRPVMSSWRSDQPSIHRGCPESARRRLVPNQLRSPPSPSRHLGAANVVVKGWLDAAVAMMSGDNLFIHRGVRTLVEMRDDALSARAEKLLRADRTPFQDEDAFVNENASRGDLGRKMILKEEEVRRQWEIGATVGDIRMR